MLLHLLFLLALSLRAFSFTLTPDAAFVISDSEPAPVRRALDNVLLDFYLVLGRRPYIFSLPPAPGTFPNTSALVFLGTLAAAPWLSTLDARVPGLCAPGWEAHCVLAPVGGAGGYANVLLATGAGDRGAMYGAYSFAEEVLGVNPWKLLLDDVPAYTGSVDVPEGLALAFPPPFYKYRAAFINDEDLLAGRFPDPLRKAAIGPETYERLFETLLRLKANMVVPATNPFPDQAVNTLAGLRGLVLSFHHYDLLGGNVFSWPLAPAAWDWERDPATMASVWRSAVGAQAAITEVVWSTGLRGLNDYAYPCTLGPARCGAQISQAIGNQTQWVRAAQGQQAQLVLYMWDELLELLEGGHLTLPEGVQVVFTDAGEGYMPPTNGNWSKYCAGVYYHTAMFTGYERTHGTNQLSELVPVDRIFAELGRAANASNSTTYFIDNVSDLKPVPMTTEAVFRFAWDPSIAAAGAGAFYAAWGARQLGLAGGPSSAPAQEYSAIWAGLFATPYIQAARSDMWLAGYVYTYAGQGAASLAASGAITASTAADAAADAQLLGQPGTPPPAVLAGLQALLARGLALAPLVAPSRARFYASHTLAQLRLHTAGCSAVLAVQAALALSLAGNASGALAAAGSAVAAGEAALAALRDAEAEPQWRGLYNYDYLTMMQRARDAAVTLAAALRAPGPHGPPLPPLDHSNLWYAWEAWQAAPAVRAAYPLSQAVSPGVSWSVAPRAACSAASVDAGACAPDSEGGAWALGKGVAVALELLPAQPGQQELVLRWTADGTAPSAQSLVYSQPIELDAAAQGRAGLTLRAASFDAAGNVQGQAQSVWRAM